MKTILITGASSGIGEATARHFQANGWNVVATMRNPDAAHELGALVNLHLARLDVTDADSITAAVREGIDRFGGIDVLLNNAGYGAYGALEAFPMDRIRRQFDTKVIGLLEVTKAVLPHMRENRAGTIINIASIGGQITFPLGTLYHGTKFAVEGLSEALHYELEPLGIRVRIVEPGMIRTDFGGDRSTSPWMKACPTTRQRPQSWVGSSASWPPIRQNLPSSQRSYGRPLTRAATACASGRGRMPRSFSTSASGRTTQPSSEESRT